ncbi:MAG: LPS export ABC transporter permease LptG [Magnetococcales bacterium]|nr:LPS export ABC transporter permease LptG [Magnetococcales bacterium]
MPLLFLYLLRLFLLEWLQIVGLFIGLFFLIDGLESIRRFSLKANFNWGEMATMILCRLPDFITLLLPSITLLAVLLILARLTRFNEITVMRASGVSIHRILIPFMLGGLLIAAGQLILQDQMVPWTKRAAYHLEEHLLGQSPSPTQVEMDNVWLKNDRQLIHLRQVLPNEQVLLEVAIFIWDAEQHLTGHIRARSANLRQGQWVLLHGIHYQYGKQVTAEKFAERVWPLSLSAEQLNRTAVNPDFLSFEQLNQLIERTEREGYDGTRLRVLLHSRLSQPATTLAAILLAFPFTLRLPRRGGVSRSLLLGLLVGFFMFVVVDLSQALGMGGRLPPVLSAWAPVLFFTGIGGFLLIHLADPKNQG